MRTTKQAHLNFIILNFMARTPSRLDQPNTAPNRTVRQLMWHRKFELRCRRLTGTMHRFQCIDGSRFLKFRNAGGASIVCHGVLFPALADCLSCTAPLIVLAAPLACHSRKSESGRYAYRCKAHLAYLTDVPRTFLRAFSFGANPMNPLLSLEVAGGCRGVYCK